MEINQQIYSDQPNQVIEVISGLINDSSFNLTVEQIKQLKNGWKDELVLGWLFAYQVYSYDELARIKILKTNIDNPNPRIREQVCDIIGDESIEILKDLLYPLIFDDIEYVASAAKYNYYQMF